MRQSIKYPANQSGYLIVGSTGFNLGNDPILSEEWPVRIYAVRATGGESWRGYEAIELRCGDRSNGQNDSTWWTDPPWSKPGTRGAIYPIVSRIYLHKGDQWSPLVYTDVGLDDTSPSSIDCASRWIENCLSSHGHNMGRDEERELPTRIIDVTPSLLRPKLKVFGRLCKEMTNYTALSYCWGQSKTTITTIHNLQEHIEAGFSYDLLPKTIQHAISITRSIGVRYLWVDALCILQGSEDEARTDWQTESSRMAAVYGNAYVTIIAADSTSSDSGILRKRSIIPEPRASHDGFIKRRIYSAFRTTNLLETASSTPNIWATRAWTLQEMVLSRRALFYTDQKKYWKCEHGLIGEDGKLARFTPTHLLTQNRMQQDWHFVVEEYAKRRLTNGADKLPALSGLASLYHRRKSTPYRAGLWAATLLGDLLWRTEISADLMPHHTQSYRAPSWSWASINGPIDYDLCLAENKGNLSEAEVISAVLVPYGLDPFGQVSAGSLKLRGKLRPITRLVIDRYHSAGDAFSGEDNLGRVYVDQKKRWEDLEEIQYPCSLFLIKDGAGLLIAPTESGPAEFRRLGVFYGRKLSRMLENWEVVTVTIV